LELINFLKNFLFKIDFEIIKIHQNLFLNKNNNEFNNEFYIFQNFEKIINIHLLIITIFLVISNKYELNNLKKLCIEKIENLNNLNIKSHFLFVDINNNDLCTVKLNTKNQFNLFIKEIEFFIENLKNNKNNNTLDNFLLKKTESFFSKKVLEIFLESNFFYDFREKLIQVFFFFKYIFFIIFILL
jgi:hypothetical protein